MKTRRPRFVAYAIAIIVAITAMPWGEAQARGGQARGYFAPKAKAGNRGLHHFRLRRNSAAIDQGSNGVKMIITDKKGRVIVDTKIGNKLGAGIGQDKLLPRANQKRAKLAAKEFASLLKKYKVKANDVRFIATAAVRNAKGTPKPKSKKITGKSLIKRLRNILGTKSNRMRILSGAKEAELGFRGALIAWSPNRLRRVVGRSVDRIMVIDTGGGSHQVSVGNHERIEALGSSQQGSHFVNSAIFAGPDGALPETLNADELARADQKLALRVRQLPKNVQTNTPLDRQVLGGSTPVLTGGLAKFVRLYFGTDRVTRGDIKRMRSALAEKNRDERPRYIAEVIAQNISRAPEHPHRLKLSKKQLEVQAEARGVAVKSGKKSYRGTNLVAKATLLLRVLELAGISRDAQSVLISASDSRHQLLLAD